MKKALLVLMLSAALPAMAGTAYLTGTPETVRTVTGKRALKCFYRYRLEEYSILVRWPDTGEDALYGPKCPATIEVE